MATNTIATVAVGDRANGSHETATRALPSNFAYATVTVNCTSGNSGAPFTGFAHPFSDPGQLITFGAQWSWDGTTFPTSTEGTITGQPTGSWGINRHVGLPNMAPSVGLGLPSDESLGGNPTHYRAYMTVAGGPITFGLTVTETTA